MTFFKQLVAKKHQSKTTALSNGVRRRLFYSLICLFLFSLTLVGLLPVLSKTLFFHIPSPSPTFDCDDGALLMLDRFSDLGIKATPIVGDLQTTGEKYQEITHVWLLVEIGGIDIAFDWGTPCLDNQHYEGYPITYDQLVEFVKQDRYNSYNDVFAK